MYALSFFFLLISYLLVRITSVKSDKFPGKFLEFPEEKKEKGFFFLFQQNVKLLVQTNP